MCWAKPGIAVAIDAEIAVAPVPRCLQRQVSVGQVESFWARWTQWEVVAKLNDQPMHIYVKRGCLQQVPHMPGVRVATRAIGPLVVSVGARAELRAAPSHSLEQRVDDPLPASAVDRPPASG